MNPCPGLYFPLFRPSYSIISWKTVRNCVSVKVVWKVSHTYALILDTKNIYMEYFICIDYWTISYEFVDFFYTSIDQNLNFMSSSILLFLRIFWIPFNVVCGSTMIPRYFPRICLLHYILTRLYVSQCERSYLNRSSIIYRGSEVR